MALRLKQELEANIKGGSVDLIAHSLGGLVARTYLQKMGGNRRVDRLVTIATPHMGTEAHVYLPSRVVSQMNPNGTFMQELNALPPPEGVRMTSIGGGEDLLVLPRRNALAPFGNQVFFEDIGHNAMLLSPQVMGAVREALHEEVS
jgi:triacylglycerol lipase